ncbi:MAG: hypothetical protein MHM6MM_001029 [Cercozoa sp. M6MM]
MKLFFAALLASAAIVTADKGACAFTDNKGELWDFCDFQEHNYVHRERVEGQLVEVTLGGNFDERCDHTGSGAFLRSVSGDECHDLAHWSTPATEMHPLRGSVTDALFTSVMLRPQLPDGTLGKLNVVCAPASEVASADGVDWTFHSLSEIEAKVNCRKWKLRHVYNWEAADFPLVAESREWHFHVYHKPSSPKEREEALALYNALNEAVEEGKFVCVPGKFWEKAVGPHPMPQYEVWTPAEYFQEVMDFVQTRRGGLSVLLHARTRFGVFDHHWPNGRAAWWGTPVPLDADILGEDLGVYPVQYPDLKLGFSNPDWQDKQLKQLESTEHELSPLFREYYPTGKSDTQRAERALAAMQ